MSGVVNLKSPEDGAVYRLKDKDGAEIYMILNTIHSTKTWNKAKLGMHHGFGIVTNQAEASRINVSFLSVETQKPLKLPYFAMSFFHLLDSTHGPKLVRVIGDWSDAIISKDSTISLGTKQNNSISFEATKTDPNLKSPQRPSFLTANQIEHAATVRFVDVDSFQLHFEIGADEFHGFLFSSTAALVCADVQGGGRPPVKFITNPQNLHLPAVVVEANHVVRVANDSVFQYWYVREGDKVGTGDKLCKLSGVHSMDSVEQRAETAGTVHHLQPLLPGDFIESGLPMMLIDTGAIDWFHVSMIAIAVIGVIVAAITCWCCCCKSEGKEPHDEGPRIGSVILDFVTPTGWTQQAIWYHQPLGLGFYENSVPPMVAYVGDDASHLGILRDDMLVGIGDDKILVALQRVWCMSS